LSSIMSIYRSNQAWLERQEKGVPDAWDSWYDHDDVIKNMTESLCHIDKISREIDMPKEFIRFRLQHHISVNADIMQCNRNEIIHLYETGHAATKIAIMRNLPRTTVNKIIADSGLSRQKSLI
jgi:hypothetical protein